MSLTAKKYLFIVSKLQAFLSRHRLDRHATLCSSRDDSNNSRKADDTEAKFSRISCSFFINFSQSTGRSAPTKDDKDNFKKVLQSMHGRLSVKMEYFRRYLQTHGEPDGFPRLENDLIFYLEVQKFKVRNIYLLYLTTLAKDLIKILVEKRLPEICKFWQQAIFIYEEIPSLFCIKDKISMLSKAIFCDATRNMWWRSDIDEFSMFGSTFKKSFSRLWNLLRTRVIKK